MTIFFTSDTHFGHKNIISFCGRPYNSVDHMNQTLINNWNETVEPDDIVYHLGDACMGDISYTLPLIGRLNGYKILVPGNHDRVFSGESQAKRERFRPLYLEVFQQIEKESFPYGGFMVSHFPYDGDSHDQNRFDKQRPKNEGLPILHGHVHSKWRMKGNQINVGVDVWDYRPVEFDALVDLFDRVHRRASK